MKIYKRLFCLISIKSAYIFVTHPLNYLALRPSLLKRGARGIERLRGE